MIEVVLVLGSYAYDQAATLKIPPFKGNSVLQSPHETIGYKQHGAPGAVPFVSICKRG
jgi:hypothetical protein